MPFSRQHSASVYHVQVTQVVSNSQQQPDVGEKLSSALHEQKAMNGRMLMVILQCIQFLGRQGGHNEKESNFIQLRSLDLQVNVCYAHFHKRYTINMLYIGYF